MKMKRYVDGRKQALYTWFQAEKEMLRRGYVGTMIIGVALFLYIIWGVMHLIFNDGCTTQGVYYFSAHPIATTPSRP